MKLKHLQLSGVKSISKEFTSFHPSCKDWTSYHMTYQKLNQHFRNVLNPGNRRNLRNLGNPRTRNPGNPRTRTRNPGKLRTRNSGNPRMRGCGLRGT